MKKIAIPMLLIGIGLMLASCSNEDVTSPFNSASESLDKMPPSGPRSAVVPPQARPHGRTYGEWSMAYWQWLWSIPAASNPVFDETGEFVSSGQSGSVWFLTRTFGGIAERTASIPSGKMLFIDVAGWFGAPAIGDPEDEEELRAALAAAVEASHNISLEIDGAAVGEIDDFRVQSPDLFGYTLPEGNVLELFGYPTPAGDYYPAACDGHYVMLAPLSVGEHTINIHAEFPEPFGISDVTYHLNVLPGSRSSVGQAKGPE